MMDLQVNKKMLKNQIQAETGKMVLLKDLSNLAQKSQNKDTFDDVINMLRNQYGCTVEMNVSENGDFIGLFFQDEVMKKDFASFPEVMCIDATYKLLEIRLPVYIFLVEDSMGLSEVVGVSVLVNEMKETIVWLIDTFKKLNPSKVRVVMADKDFNERDTISKLWCCPVLICLFHSLKAFKRGIADLKISKTDSDTAKELFEKMCYSFSMDVYNDTYKDLKALGNTQIWNYFYKNWHPIRQD
uniref:ZSWIM1/3 RNaseH-like domain-containing protein n=2 Tax=Clytia hemisphaerica TaxID=252671 RepID=A0A7M5WSU9_9CNID